MIKRKLSHLQIIALGFAVIIAAGTFLLSLPAASSAGIATPFLTALFTATSASCVTGLVLVDTAVYWSLFGQIVIIILIQLGGLGFMTVATVFFSFAKKNIGLRKRAIMAESINTTHIAGLKNITRRIVCGTICFELAGAVLLSSRFIGEFGFVKGVYYGIFHSISAFCNAGFDLMGINEKFSSLVDYSDDITVNMTVMILITVGGIGFLVWDDIAKNKLKFRRYHLHTKLVLISSALLTFGGAALFYVFEHDGVLAGLPLKERILDSLFSSVTCRTAGFNTVDLAGLSKAGMLFMSFLMYVGGSSGSTAGGIKTTTIAVAFIHMFTSLRGIRHPRVFGRTFEDGTMKKAFSVMLVNFMLSFTGAVLILAIQDLPMADVIFETSSAMATVGMSSGVTRELVPASQLIIIFLMFCGRVGSTSFALALLEKRAAPPVTYPTENITIG